MDSMTRASSYNSVKSLPQNISHFIDSKSQEYGADLLPFASTFGADGRNKESYIVTPDIQSNGTRLKTQMLISP